MSARMDARHAGPATCGGGLGACGPAHDPAKAARAEQLGAQQLGRRLACWLVRSPRVW
jgi:hypothetical protein